MSAYVTASSVLCAGGRGTEQLWATVRAGISCITRSSAIDKNFDAISMGLVPFDALPPLPPEIDALPLPASARRMLQLATPAFLAAIERGAVQGASTVYLGFPEPDVAALPWADNFLRLLGQMAGRPIDVESSRIFPLGRAASMQALTQALKAFETADGTVIVGGVDTYFNLRRIAQMDFEQRILGPRVMDGFIPGEGAAFAVLESEPPALPAPQIKILGASVASDPGHRYGTEPALGQGLSDAIEKLRAGLSGKPLVNSIFAAFNGENFEAKLWGVARLRHSDFFVQDAIMQHPADCIGDTGAASGAILTALAAHALAASHREGNALVWAASDHAPRGCALLGV